MRDNQLDLFVNYSPEEPPKEEKKEELSNDEAANRAIKSIYEKIEASRQAAKEKERKVGALSLKEELGKIEKNTDLPKQENASEDDDWVEPFAPSEEYYGRFNQFRKRR